MERYYGLIGKIRVIRAILISGIVLGLMAILEIFISEPNKSYGWVLFKYASLMAVGGVWYVLLRHLWERKSIPDSTKNTVERPLSNKIAQTLLAALIMGMVLYMCPVIGQHSLSLMFVANILTFFMGINIPRLFKEIWEEPITLR